MSVYETGDFVKAEFKDGLKGESEWMWVRVDYCDDQSGIVFGWLDNEPISHRGELKIGQHLAISYDNVRDHRKDFQPRAAESE
jgi:hypothetical protein